MPRPNVDPDDNYAPVFNENLGIFPTIGSPVGAQSGYDEGFDKWLENYMNLRTELRLAKYDSAGISYFRNKFNPPPGPLPPNDPRRKFDNPGEYLYEVLSRIDVDGTSGVEALGNAAIGNSDVDDDPAMPDPYLEVVDAWGNPLQLRILQVKQ